MQKIGSNINFNEVAQWFGAVCITLGHGLNAIGPTAHPWNILAFFLGTLGFLWWSLRVVNKPQILVNVVAVTISVIGLARALG